MNESDISELLKAAKDMPLLNAGINTGIVVSTYPTKEHRDYLEQVNARVSTDNQRPEILPATAHTSVPHQRTNHDLQRPQKRESSQIKMASYTYTYSRS
jgi:hypothetical protein